MEAKKISRNRSRLSWNPDELTQLIALWQKYISETKSAKQNNRVFAAIAKDLGEALSCSATPVEVYLKLVELTLNYRLEKKALESGEITSPTWKYYSDVAALLHNFTEDDFIDKSSNYSTDQVTVPILIEEQPGELIKTINASSSDTPTTSQLQNLANTSAEFSAIEPSTSQSQSSSPPVAVTKPTRSAAVRRKATAASPASPTPSTAPKRSRTFEADLLKELKRTNDFIVKDQKLSQMFLKESRELDKKWNAMLKDFLTKNRRLQQQLKGHYERLYSYNGTGTRP